METEFYKLIKLFRNNKNFVLEETERIEYLRKWFSLEILTIIEKLRTLINISEFTHKSILLLIISDLLREYSLQEPQDLRIRKRKSPLPEKPFIVNLEQSFEKKLEELRKTYEIIHPRLNKGKAFFADSKDLKSIVRNGIKMNSIDYAITSPPYATALPYIDTQRLSLVWLGLIESSHIKKEEEVLIGSRELSKSEINKFNELIKNDRNIPTSVSNFCLNLLNNLSNNDGFRRQAVPALMYKYFNDMYQSFLVMLKLLKSKSQYSLIVGTNSTTLGGTTIHINTPEFLGLLAESAGWKLKEYITLDTYKRFSMHSANSIKDETLIMLEK